MEESRGTPVLQEIGEFPEGLENSRNKVTMVIKEIRKKTREVRLSRSTKARVVHGLGGEK